VGVLFFVGQAGVFGFDPLALQRVIPENREVATGIVEDVRDSLDLGLVERRILIVANRHLEYLVTYAFGDALVHLVEHHLELEGFLGMANDRVG